MSFSQHLVLWVHVAFVIFTIGPATLAIMSTPRYIRQRDTRVLRYLHRMTAVFAIGTLGVLIAGMALASMLSEAGKPWVIVSATLFLVAIVLLVLITRDQRLAIKSLEAATAAAATAAGLTDAQVSTALERPTSDHAPVQADPGSAGAQPAATAEAEPPSHGGQPAPSPSVDPAAAIPSHLASVERGRIAMLGGVVSLIWLVILVLMVWNS